jgi:hypothetical protein
VYGDNKMAQWLDWCVGGTVVGGACGYESVYEIMVSVASNLEV